MAYQLDPVMSPREMEEEAGISRATWNRQFRHVLPVVRLSSKRIGVRRSHWLAELERRTGKADEPLRRIEQETSALGEVA